MADDINLDDAVAAATPTLDWTTDIRLLAALRDDLRRPTTVDRDGYPTYWEQGYKPRDPQDPRWLWALTIALTIAAALSIPLIIVFGE